MPRVYRKMLFALILALLTTCLSTSLTFAQGGSWAIVSSPNQGTLGNQLFGVAAVSVSDIWAVGDYNDGPYKHNSRTLTEHWNGSSWQIVKSPNPATGTDDYDQLLAVAAVSTSNVWAVGYELYVYYYYTVIEHWNGTTWSQVSSPNPNCCNQLFGVAALSATSVWAVGYTSGRPLVEKWNGKHWTVVPTANVNTFDTFQAAATIPTTGDVWAVGEDFQIIHNTSVHKTLVEQCMAC